MKKFFALVFALIFALSACTVAFAAEATTTTTAAPQTYECDKCHKVLKSASAFNEHYYGGGCDVLFADCPYCADRILAAHKDEHYGVCKDYSETCKYCTEEFDTKAKFEAHKCEVLGAVENEDVAGVVGDAITAVKGIDWEEVLNKVIEFVKSIDFDALVAEVEGIIAEVEAVLADLDIEGIFAEVKGFLGGLKAE